MSFASLFHGGSHMAEEDHLYGTAGTYKLWGQFSLKDVSPPPPLDPSRPLGILVGHFLSSRMLALAGCAGKGDPTWLTIRHGEPHGVAGCAVFSANACKPTASMNTPYRSCAVVR